MLCLKSIKKTGRVPIVVQSSVMGGRLEREKKKTFHL